MAKRHDQPARHGALPRRALLAAPALLAMPATGLAQPAAWPAQAVRIVTPSPPGSSVDVVARVIADGLSRRHGQPFVVDNRPGADGVIAADNFAKSRAGSALLFAAAGLYTAAPLMFAPLPYDTAAELIPIGAAVTDFLGFVVSPQAVARSLQDLLALVREQPGRLSWAAAPGAYLFINAFLRSRDLAMNYVNYRALTAMLPDVATGLLDLAYVPLTPAMPLVNEGKLRLLAVSNSERSAAAPGVPTVREIGLSALEVDGFPGLFGWRGIRDALRDRLSQELAEIVHEPAAVERFARIGLAPRGHAAARFAADLATYAARYAEAARLYGARPAD